LSSVDFIVKLRDALQMAADACQEYLEGLVPTEDGKVELKEAFNSINWQAGEGAKGPYEMAREAENKDGEAFNQFNHLRSILKQNNGRFTEKSWTHYYWLGSQDDKVIFRRKKKWAT